MASRRMRGFIQWAAKKKMIPESHAAEMENPGVDGGEGIPSPVHGEGEDNGYYASGDEDGSNSRMKFFSGGEVPDSAISPSLHMFEGGEARESGISAPEDMEDGEQFDRTGPEMDSKYTDTKSSQFPDEMQFAHGGMAGHPNGAMEWDDTRELDTAGDEETPGEFGDPMELAYGGMAKGGRMAPGGGGRFQAMKDKMASQGAEDPGALAAFIGRKAYGKSKFQKMAAHGRHRAALAKAVSRK